MARAHLHWRSHGNGNPRQAEAAQYVEQERVAPNNYNERGVSVCVHARLVSVIVVESGWLS